MRSTPIALSLALVLAACGGDPGPSPEIDAGVCATTKAVQAADRKIIGAGAGYDADQTLRGREAELAASQKRRRELAWKTVAKVLAPVDPAQPLPARLPRWHSWYAKDDVNRLFERLYPALGPEGRAQRAHFSEAALDEAFAWNVSSVDELPNWPPERWQEYLASIDSPVKAAGVGGIARVSYSPAAARHLLNSYPELLTCLKNGAPDRFVDGPKSATRRMAREPLELDACADASYGPYFVAGGETLHASASDAQVTVRRDGAVACHAEAGQACQTRGPGTFDVLVSAGGKAARGMLEVDYSAPDVPWAACLPSAFPSDAVVVKADWRRVLPDMPLAVYDTSAEGLARRLSEGGKFNWGPGDGTADPGPDDIYTAQVGTGNVYRLAALHIMTKELDHWLWITLWWSPSTTSDLDFGADRPADVRALGGPWGHYKMCVTTAFEERDPAPDGGFGGTLGKALAAVNGRGGAVPASWCSNPYLEVGDGNADTNCLGCHQHAGTGLLPETILGDPVLFPAHGRTVVRNNFPSDYSYAVDQGDRLSRLFADVVAYWDTAAP
jgi:hypothetical protein